MPTEKELAKSGYFGFHTPVENAATQFKVGEYRGFEAPEPVKKAPKKAAKKSAKKKKAKK